VNIDGSAPTFPATTNPNPSRFQTLDDGFHAASGSFVAMPRFIELAIRIAARPRKDLIAFRS
jgi:hypothetical protein